MKRLMVRYRVKPDRVAENEQLVRAVYEELERLQPAGFRYGTFKLDDGVTFVHVAIEDPTSPLAGLDSFERFRKGLGERVEEGPVATELREVGSFRLFDG